MTSEPSHLTVARRFLSAGLCVVPANDLKHPALAGWKDFQGHLPIADEVDEWFSRKPYGIGFVCGLVSGGLEVLDLDAKHDPSGTLNARAEAAIREFAPGLWERMVIERTPTGGLHLYFRCALPARNLKLAYCLNGDGKRMAVAETRGEGGFIMAAPSPGYVLIQGALELPPTLTDDSRSALFAAARSLDTAPLPPAPDKPAVNTKARTDFHSSGDLRPGDAYNASDQFKDELLRPIGWTTHNEKNWTRPGKTVAEGNSANWDTMSELPRHFHCFTPNAYPLVDGETYTPFGLYAVLKCGGDLTQAARELGARGFGSPPKVRQRPPEMDPDIQAQLDTAQEASGQHNGHSDVIPEEQWERIAAASRERAAMDSPIGNIAPNAAPLTAKPPAQDDWPEPVSADEICANPPALPPELIQGILYMIGTMLLSGPSKSHKTFSALDVGIAIAVGGKWLGYQTTQSVVLYLNLELQDFSSTERVARISAARGHKPPHDLKIWNLRGKTITLAALTAQLPAMIKKLGAKVVCIDPHYKVSAVSDMEENSNDSQGKLLTLLEGLCANAGAALILTHHFAKGDASSKNAIDRASGGGVFARWGDVMLTFTPHEEDDAMSVEMSLRNFAPQLPFVVRWEYPRWIRDDQLDAKDLKTSRGPKERHTPDRLLKKLGDELLSYAEWMKRSGLSETTFRRKRQDLLDDGLVEQVGTCYRKK